MKFQGSQGSTTGNPVTLTASIQTDALQDVLVVDADPRTCETVRHALPSRDAIVRYAPSIEQAELEMSRKPADLLVINVQISDNMGLDLLARLRRRFPQTHALALSRQIDPDLCLSAWRAGATDMLVHPFEPAAIAACIRRVEDLRSQHQQTKARNRRLRSVCKQLNKARHEISQQVNLLCHDLVKAYQDLAQQLNETQQSGDFAAMLGNDVEIETLLRHAMEWVLQKVGPVNAAVFLPDSEQNYALGAFLNYDTGADSVLVDLISNTIVKQAAGGVSVLALDRDSQLDELFGKDAKLLRGRKWLACPAYYRNECLAVMVIFQQQGEPLNDAWTQLLETACPVLAQRIARSVRVYQRGLGTDEDDSDQNSGV